MLHIVAAFESIFYSKWHCNVFLGVVFFFFLEGYLFTVES